MTSREASPIMSDPARREASPDASGPDAPGPDSMEVPGSPGRSARDERARSRSPSRSRRSRDRSRDSSVSERDRDRSRSSRDHDRYRSSDRSRSRRSSPSPSRSRGGGSSPVSSREAHWRKTMTEEEASLPEEHVSAMQAKFAEFGVSEDLLPEYYKVLCSRALAFANNVHTDFVARSERQAALQKKLAQEELQRLIHSWSTLYIGNIPHEITPQQLFEIFSTFGYIRSSDMPFDSATQKFKGFGFVEYEVPEAATAAFIMNGLTLGTHLPRSIRVSRPSKVDQTRPNGGLPPPTENRAYLANISPRLTEDVLSRIFNLAGEVTRCVLVPDPLHPGFHKTYGFVEFSEPASVNKAIESYHGYDIEGRQLCVTRSVAGLDLPEGMSSMDPGMVLPPEAAPQSAPFIATQIGPNGLATRFQGGACGSGAIGGGAPSGQPIAGAAPIPMPTPSFGGDRSPAGIMPIPGPGGPVYDPTATALRGGGGSAMQQAIMRELLVNSVPASQTLLLENMARNSDVMDKEEAEDFVAEIRSECERSGPIRAIVFHVFGDRADPNAPVRFFVRFNTTEAAVKCQDVMNGRWFAGQRIVARLYDDAKFLSEDFTA